MQTIKEVIEDIKDKLEQLNVSIHYVKINDISKHPHIYIIEQKRRIISEDMVDKAYESTIEIDYVSNKVPANFYELYDIRDSIVKLLEDDYNIYLTELEIGDNECIIHLLLKVKVI